MTKMMIASILLSACADTASVVTAPDASHPSVSCSVEILQTLNGDATCAVTGTLTVACVDASAGVASATITAITDPSLETGLQTSTAGIGCGRSVPFVFVGMPCEASATVDVALDDDVVCGATKSAEL